MTASDSSKAQRPARLSQPKSFRLANWLLANVESLQHKSFRDIAKLASDHLEFPVSPGSIPPHAEIAGIKLTGRTPQPGAPRTASDRVQIVAFAVRDLYTQLGQPIPPTLDAVCKRQNPAKVGGKS